MPLKKISLSSRIDQKYPIIQCYLCCFTLHRRKLNSTVVLSIFRITMVEKDVKSIIVRGILWSLVVWFFTFSFGFGIAYISHHGWILSVPVTVVLLAVVFIITLTVSRQLEWGIIRALIIFLSVPGIMLCFIHALMNILALSGDLWVVYLSVCFVTGFLIDFLYTSSQ